MTLVAPRVGVEDRAYSDASAFMDVLGARHELWRTETWVFRGHADATWCLRATAVRDDDAFTKYALPECKVSEFEAAWSARAGLQNQLLKQFRTGLNHSGLIIPSPPPCIDFRERDVTSSNAAPSPEAFPLMALAQHHGLPTLLLDWTRRAWIAAYFAAVDAADAADAGRKSAKYLAVWALQRIPAYDDARPSLFYEAPGGTNPNLRAQGGLFTFFVVEDEPSLEEYLRRREEGGASPACKLRRMILPVSEAPRLLRLLGEEGITGAALFPGPNGVVRSMRERALWSTD